MGQVKSVTVKVAHSPSTPLDEIKDKSEWPDQIYRQPPLRKAG